MNWSIIHYDYRPWTRKSIAMRQKFFFNKGYICICIDRSLVYTACKISIDRHRWQYTEVPMPFKCNFLGNNLSLQRPSMCSITRACIDSRFIKENDLLSIPACQLAKPGISKLWGPLCCLLCQLQLENFLKIMPFCVRNSGSLIVYLVNYLIPEPHSDC